MEIKKGFDRTRLEVEPGRGSYGLRRVSAANTTPNGLEGRSPYPDPPGCIPKGVMREHLIRQPLCV